MCCCASMELQLVFGVERMLHVRLYFLCFTILYLVSATWRIPPWKDQPFLGWSPVPTPLSSLITRDSFAQEPNLDRDSKLYLIWEFLANPFQIGCNYSDIMIPWATHEPNISRACAVGLVAVVKVWTNWENRKHSWSTAICNKSHFSDSPLADRRRRVGYADSVVDSDGSDMGPASTAEGLAPGTKCYFNIFYAM